MVILRGNSASGKSSVAQALREAYGRGLAIIGQDNVRRTVLRERDVPGGANIGLIDLMARYALDHGFHVVVVEGILYADRYGDMLTALMRDHKGLSRAYYFDIPFDVTLERHATKSIADEVGETELRDWWRPRDLLPGGVEEIVDEHSTVEDTVARIFEDCALTPGVREGACGLRGVGDSQRQARKASSATGKAEVSK
ncbi:AAA family ATPase [Nocardiopsis exhalans]|uniref:AAA family ATPase n=1 Tax=Nocardiopsis exhalans TaxID=163604 RepID=A0ABY5D125_9ACTN|nr:AAA family ATPase [Nocardiopsis exhalans]USY17984.1 AAA family ATPase [Nocardiopsis exhalans]